MRERERGGEKKKTKKEKRKTLKRLAYCDICPFAI